MHGVRISEYPRRSWPALLRSKGEDQIYQRTDSTLASFMGGWKREEGDRRRPGHGEPYMIAPLEATNPILGQR